MPKSIDQLMEEEERFEAQARAEKARGAVEEEQLLRKARSRWGKDGWKDHSENGMKSGLDWSALKFKVGVPEGKSMAQAPRFSRGDRQGNE